MPLEMPAMTSSGPTTPATGPSAITPGPQPGLEAQALIKVRQAAMLLADAVGMLKARLGTDLGKAALGALKQLSPHTPGVEEGLGQSELASMQQGQMAVRPAPPPGKTPPWVGTKQPTPARVGGPPFGGGSNPLPGR